MAWLPDRLSDQVLLFAGRLHPAPSLRGPRRRFSMTQPGCSASSDRGRHHRLMVTAIPRQTDPTASATALSHAVEAVRNSLPMGETASFLINTTFRQFSADTQLRRTGLLDAKADLLSTACVREPLGDPVGRWPGGPPHPCLSTTIRLAGFVRHQERREWRVRVSTLTEVLSPGSVRTLCSGMAGRESRLCGRE